MKRICRLLLLPALFFLTISASAQDTGDCDTCISRFMPDTGKTYVFSAWVSCKDWMDDWNDHLTLTIPTIRMFFNGPDTYLKLKGRGDIIDGWQRIDTTFRIPYGTTELELQFYSDSSSSDTSFYDDVRIFPLGATMKSFVYDQTTMQFVAELDENNYATFYEYDEDGILVRVKRETIRGIETVKETRNNTIKK